MVKQISFKSEMPKWFDVKKYAFVNDLSDKELLRELGIRWIINQQAQAIHKTPEVIQHFERSFIGEAWEEIQGVGRISDKDIASIFYFNPTDKKNFPPDSKIAATVFENGIGVRALSVWDFIAEGRSMTEKLNMSVENPRRKTFELVETSYGELASSSSFAAANRHFPQLNSQMQIAVDLSYDDKQIIDSITALLPVWREHKRRLGVFAENPPKMSPNPSDTTLKKVREYNLLAYIDLMIWSALSGSKIRNKVIEHLLYPGTSHLLGERHVQTVLAPLYKKLMYSKLLVSLGVHFGVETE